MNTNPNCIFCKIAKHEIPANIVYEDDNFVAFLDIQPSAIGHTLLVPKVHVTWWLDLNDNQTKNIFTKAKVVAKTLKEVTGSDFVRLNIVGTDVPHLHLHLIPLKLGEDKNLYRKVEYKDGEAEALIENIKLNI